MMQLYRLMLLVFISMFLSCTQSEFKDKKIVKTKNSISTQKPQINIDSADLLNRVRKNSFVFSCGSGCAMRYNVKKVSGSKALIIVKFSVEMFEDEVETEDYEEMFFFYYNNNQKLEKIIRDDETESFLETQPTTSKREFESFAEKLILEFN